MIPLLILTPLILLAALGAVWLARPVHAALLLALTLALIAVFYLTVGRNSSAWSSSWSMWAGWRF